MDRSLKTILPLLKDRKIASSSLNKALQTFDREDNPDELLSLLRQLTKINGGMSSLSKKIGVNRQNLYRTLFAHTGNPKFKSLASILKGLGYRIAIEPLEDQRNLKTSTHKEDTHL